MSKCNIGYPLATSFKNFQETIVLSGMYNKYLSAKNEPEIQKLYKELSEHSYVAEGILEYIDTQTQLLLNFQKDIDHALEELAKRKKHIEEHSKKED